MKGSYPARLITLIVIVACWRWESALDWPFWPTLEQRERFALQGVITQAFKQRLMPHKLATQSRLKRGLTMSI